MSNLGSVSVLEQKEMTAFPQHNVVGAKYKPVAYVGTQLVKGINHVFIAEQTLTTLSGGRHIVLVTVNEYNNNYELAMIERIV